MYRIIALPKERLVIYGKKEIMDYLESYRKVSSISTIKEATLFLTLNDLSGKLSTYEIIPVEMTYYYHVYCRVHHIETNTKWENFLRDGQVLLHTLPIYAH